LPDLASRDVRWNLHAHLHNFKAFRAAHPDHMAVTYINCSAEVKALSDIIVTSTNAKSILRADCRPIKKSFLLQINFWEVILS
jgi:quinolinate synthase